MTHCTSVQNCSRSQFRLFRQSTIYHALARHESFAGILFDCDSAPAVRAGRRRSQSRQGGKSRLTPFIFNNIPALCSYLLCFHIDSRLAPEFSTAVLCFQQHSRIAPSKRKNSSSRKQTSCPVEKEDSSAAFIPPGLRLRTDLRRCIEKGVRECPWAPAERTLTMLAYLAPPVKRQNAAVRCRAELRSAYSMSAP